MTAAHWGHGPVNKLRGSCNIGIPTAATVGSMKGCGMRRLFMVLAAVILIATQFTGVPVGAASSFAAPAFQTQWQAGEAIAPNFWGPLAAAHDGTQEPYKEASAGSRLVQYFDKARMELTNPATGVVTNGLLATELVKGQIQVGNDAFQTSSPPIISVAGDIDNPGPTYAGLASKGKTLFDAAPKQTGNATQATASATGDVTANPIPGSPALIFATFDDTTKHNLPQAFADYRARAGLTTIGLALCEPFVSNVRVAGAQKQVMIQVFERRVLTYTATNPAAYQVEMGNIGQHYFQWRYGIAPPPPSPVAAVAAPTRTVVPAPTQAPITPTGYQTWTDITGLISVRYPIIWRYDPSVAKGRDEILGLSSLSLPAIVTLSTSPVDGRSLSEYTKFAADAARTFLNNAVPSSPRSLTLDGEPALLVAVAGNDPRSGRLTTVIYTVVFHRGQRYEFLAIGSGDSGDLGDAFGALLAGVTFPA